MGNGVRAAVAAHVSHQVMSRSSLWHGHCDEGPNFRASIAHSSNRAWNSALAICEDRKWLTPIARRFLKYFKEPRMSNSFHFLCNNFSSE